MTSVLVELCYIVDFFTCLLKRFVVYGIDMCSMPDSHVVYCSYYSMYMCINNLFLIKLDTYVSYTNICDNNEKHICISKHKTCCRYFRIYCAVGFHSLLTSNTIQYGLFGVKGRPYPSVTFHKGLPLDIGSGLFHSGPFQLHGRGSDTSVKP